MRNFTTVSSNPSSKQSKRACVCYGREYTRNNEPPSKRRTSYTKNMGIPLSKNQNFRSNKNIDRAFKNGSSFHPSFEVEDVVTNNGGSMQDSRDAKTKSIIIESCASFLKKATVNSVRVSEEEVKDVHAEEVLKKHVIDEKNFLGVPTALDENDMDSPLSHYFINSR